METHSQPTITTPTRLDQRLTEETQNACQALLNTFPELRSVAIVLDYDMNDAGSLPAGTWIPRRALRPNEALKAIQAVDRISFQLRQQHDHAVAQLIRTIQRQTEDKTDGSTQSSNTEQVRPDAVDR